MVDWFCARAALWLFSLATARAQVATGTPAFGSFGGGLGIVDNANLNVHLGVPVLAKGGRGPRASLYTLQEFPGPRNKVNYLANTRIGEVQLTMLGAIRLSSITALDNNSSTIPCLIPRPSYVQDIDSEKSSLSVTSVLGGDCLTISISFI